MKVIKSIFFIFLIQSFCIAQTYIGKNKLGKLEFLNDSTCLLSFLRENGGVIRSNECSFVKKNDTIFLSSRIPYPYEINISDKEIPIISGIPFIIKIYSKEKEKYKFAYEYGVIWDSIQDKIIINGYNVKSGDLLILLIGSHYTRLKVLQKMKYFSLTRLKESDGVLFFNKFPLLIKGNKLIPCGNKDQMEDCWIYNGFYFPILKLSKKNNPDFETLRIWTIGLRGLCNCNGY